MSKTRIECLNEPCRAPVACGGFGYCRMRNFLTPEEDAADSIGSFHTAIETIGAEVKAGTRPVPDSGYFAKRRGQ